MTRSRLIIGLVVLAACSRSYADEIYVPGPAYSESLDIRTAQGDSAVVAVGTALTLHARRTSGPWVRVPRRSLAPDGCWIAPPLDPIEAEVAGNVRWTSDPPGAEFNTDLRMDQTRQVRFLKPGVYLLTAHSNGRCAYPSSGDTLRVEVVVAR